MIPFFKQVKSWFVSEGSEYSPEPNHVSNRKSLYELRQLISSIKDNETKITKLLERDLIGKTVLHYAASQSREHVEGILECLETGCPAILDLIGAKEVNGRTAFHLAITDDSWDILSYLMSEPKRQEAMANHKSNRKSQISVSDDFNSKPQETLTYLI